MYFLSGWTTLCYIAFPMIRIFTGAQPLTTASADQFLLHFLPYFGVALLSVAVVGEGSYTFAALALAFANFWVHVHASVSWVLRRPGRFVVTPKTGGSRRQLRPAIPALVAAILLAIAAIYGLAKDHSPATLNNVAFASIHIAVLLGGTWPALTKTPDQRSGACRCPNRRLTETLLVGWIPVLPASSCEPHLDTKKEMVEAM